MSHRNNKLSPISPDISDHVFTWRKSFLSGTELLYLYKKNNYRIENRHYKSLYGCFEREEKTTVYDFYNYYLDDNGPRFNKAGIYANGIVYDDAGNVLYSHRYGKITNKHSEEYRRYDIFYDKTDRVAFYHLNGKIYDENKKEIIFKDKNGNKIQNNFPLQNRRIEKRKSNYFYLPDFDLEMDPENLLSYVYQLKKFHDEETNKELRIKPLISKRTIMLLSAYRAIFGVPLTLRRNDKLFTLNNHFDGFNELEKKRIQDSINLHNNLANDLKNRHNILKETQGQKDAFNCLSIDNYIAEFNEYIQNRKPPLTETLAIGNTALSSLEFKNWLIHQRKFKTILIASKNKVYPKSVRKLIKTSIINRICDATDDTWLNIISNKNMLIEDLLKNNINLLIKNKTFKNYIITTTFFNTYKKTNQNYLLSNNALINKLLKSTKELDELFNDKKIKEELLNNNKKIEKILRAEKLFSIYDRVKDLKHINGFIDALKKLCEKYKKYVDKNDVAKKINASLFLEPPDDLILPLNENTPLNITRYNKKYVHCYFLMEDDLKCHYILYFDEYGQSQKMPISQYAFLTLHENKKVISGLKEPNLKNLVLTLIKNNSDNKKNNDRIKKDIYSINNIFRPYKIYIHTNDTLLDEVFETKPGITNSSTTKSHFLNEFRNSYIWNESKDELYYVRKNGKVENANIPKANITAFRKFLEQKKDHHDPTIVTVFKGELKRFETVVPPNECIEPHHPKKTKTWEHKNKLLEVASKLRKKFIESDWLQSKPNIKLISLYEDEPVPDHLFDLAKKLNTPIIIRRIDKNLEEKYYFYGNHDGKGKWKQTFINDPTSIKNFFQIHFKGPFNDILRLVYTNGNLINKINAGGKIIVPKDLLAWAKSNNAPIFFRNTYKENNEDKEAFFYLTQDAFEQWELIKINRPSDYLKKILNENKNSNAMFNKYDRLVERLAYNPPEEIKHFPQFKKPPETIVSNDKYLDLPPEVKKLHISFIKRAMHTHKVDDNSNQPIKVPTPIKTMINKLEAVSKYNTKYSMEETLRQITALALIEINSNKNSFSENAFYGKITEFIHIEKTLKNIRNKISNTKFTAKFKYDPIDGKRIPITISRNIDVQSKEDPEFDEFQHYDPKRTIQQIVKIAKEKAEELSIFRLFRDKKTQKFYENYSDFIVLKDDASLENIVDHLQLFTEYLTPIAVEKSRIQHKRIYDAPEDPVPFHRTFSPYDSDLYVSNHGQTLLSKFSIINRSQEKEEKEGKKEDLKTRCSKLKRTNSF